MGRYVRKIEEASLCWEVGLGQMEDLEEKKEKTFLSKKKEKRKKEKGKRKKEKGKRKRRNKKGKKERKKENGYLGESDKD